MGRPAGPAARGAAEAPPRGSSAGFRRGLLAEAPSAGLPPPRANLVERFYALAVRQVVPIALLGEWDALDGLHCEVGTAVGRRAGVVDLGDGGMVHQGQGLPLRLEPRDDLIRVHPVL